MRNLEISTYPDKGSWEDRIKFLLQFASFAPSTHNSQPWLCDIDRNICTVKYNHNIKLSESDPYNIYTLISLGCFVENLLIASNYYNIPTRINYIKKYNNLLDIKIYFGEGHTSHGNDNLFPYIMHRKNVRGEFKENIIDNSILRDIKELNVNKNIFLDIYTDKKDINLIATLTAKAIRIKYFSSSFRKEMSKWIVPSFSKRRTGLHGYSLRAPYLLSLVLPFLVRFFNLGTLLSKLNFQSINKASGVMIFSGDNNREEVVLEVGRLAERVMLYCVSKGLKTAIFIASLETEITKNKIKNCFNIDNPLFIIVFGKMDENIPFSPRKFIDDFVFIN